jgi:transposase
MELPNDIASCHRIILELVSFVDGIKPQLKGYAQKVEQLESRVKELEAQLHQNSRNSNYPSSMDKFKPKPAFPRLKGGKIDGKPGHDGGTLKMVPAPDVVKTHTPEVCARCGQIPQLAQG